METGFAHTLRRGAKRRLVGLSIFWTAWTLGLGIANGVGFIDSAVVVNVVR
jgi:hypothetical protein